MGSKQSKRSVDISGKEGESAAAGGEVVAAGGEGRVEPIADQDTLKPQVNGDTPHIEPPELISDKEKQLENGTPENEKDATTEKESVVVTNGSGGDEDKQEENGDAKPASDAENNKKNKKDKVKRKWSFRSISFSRKDKPKQEKKQKEDAAKTNGETDKLAEEEGIEATAVAESKSEDNVKEATKAEEAIEEKKTPETPVTEPITNGSSAPETPKEETVSKEAPVIEIPTVETKPPAEPEKLEVNGLSHDDKEHTIEVKSAEIETKVEETPEPVSVEPTSTPDIPVTSEVCVGQIQVNEPTPPPLPANPPPSSVTAFAETTMAPHVIETSLSPAPESVKSIVEDITPLVTNVSPRPNLNENIIEQPLNNDVIVEKKAQDSNKLTESVPEDIIAKVEEPIIGDKIGEPNVVKPVVTSESLDKTEIINDIAKNERECSEIIESGADKIELAVSNVESSELCETKISTEIESVPQIDDIKGELIINTNEKKTVTNGEIMATELIEHVPITNGTSEISEKVNGCSVESQSPVIESSNLDELSQPLSKPINLKESVEELVTRENKDVMILPPPITQANVEENGEENSNEEMSESFPLPPSELCPSSEASAAASPDHTQEVTPVADITAKMSVTEISTDKTVVADIQETATAEVGSGAGDGAPSD